MTPVMWYILNDMPVKGKQKTFIKILVMAVLLLGLCAGGAWGQTTYTWDGGGGDNNWTTAGNWNPNVIPGNLDSVIFPNQAGALTVSLSSDVEIAHLVIGENVAISTDIHNLTVNGVVDGQSSAGIISSGGDLSFNQIGRLGLLSVSAGTLNISGDSSITLFQSNGVSLAPGGNLDLAGIESLGGAILLTVSTGHELSLGEYTDTGGTLSFDVTNARLTISDSDVTPIDSINLSGESDLNCSGTVRLLSLTAGTLSNINIGNAIVVIDAFDSSSASVISDGGSLSVSSMVTNRDYSIAGPFGAFSSPSDAGILFSADVSFSDNVTLANPTASSLSVNGKKVTFSGNTNFSIASDYELNDLLILPGASLTLAGAGTQLNIAGDWINRGTFIHGGKSINITEGNGPSTIAGNNTYYGFSSSADDKEIIFEAGSIQTVTDFLNIRPSNVTRYISLKSSNPGEQWGLNSGVAGTIGYVFVSDGNSSGTSQIDVSDAPSIDLGNNSGTQGWTGWDSTGLGWTTWEGGMSSNWSDVGNWSNGVPNSIKRAVIPVNIQQYPYLSENSRTQQLFIAGDAFIDIDDFTLTSDAEIRNDGIFILSSLNSILNGNPDTDSGTVEYRGTASFFTNSDGWPGSSYYSLKINTTGNFTAESAVVINGDLVITTGQLVLNGQNITVYGDISSSVTTPFSGNGTVVVANNRSVTTSGSLNFNNLTIGTGSTLNLGGDISISGDFINNGTLNANGYTVTFNGNTNISGNTTDFSNVEITGSLTLAADIGLSGDWMNSGSFTHGGHEVEFITGSSTSYISGESVFSSLKCIIPGKNLVFESGRTQTVDSLFLKGSSTGLISLKASSFSPFILDNTAGADSVDYVSVSNVNVLSNDITAGYNSVQGSNVDTDSPGWVFLRDVFEWTGNAGDQSWVTLNNWEKTSGDPVLSAPGLVDWVSIPGGKSSYPAISSSIVVKSVSISTGAELTIDNGGDLNITYLNNDGRVILDGTGAISKTDTDSGTFVFRNRNVIDFGSLDYYNLEIAAGTVALPAEIRVANNISLTGGTLETSGQGLLVGGSWSHTGGVFSAGAAAGDIVTFTGNGSISGQPAFRHLTIASGAAVTLGSDLTVDGNILLNGTLNGSSRTINVGGNWNRGSGLFNAQSSTVNFIAGAGASQILGSNTFNVLASTSAGKIIQFEAGRTQVFSDLNIVGLSGTPVTLEGTSAAVWTLNNQKGSPAVVSYVQVNYGQVDDAGSNIQALNSSFDGNTDTAGPGAYWENLTPVLRTWTGGGVVSNWLDPANWNTNPEAVSEIDSFIIPVVPNYPALTSNITVFDLTINSGAQLTSSADIIINGSLSNSGSIIRSGGSAQNITKNDSEKGVVRYTNAGTYAIQTYPGTDYYGLEIAGGTAQLAGDLEVAGGLTISAGIFAQSSGTVSFVGTEAAVINGAPVLYNLSVDKSTNGITINNVLNISNNLQVNSGSLSLAADIVIVNDLVLAGGEIIAGANTLTLGGSWNRSTGIFTANTSTVIFDDSSKNSIISGSNTFYTLTVSTQNKTLRFPAGQTQTATAFNVAGIPGNLVNLLSTVNGSRWFLDAAGGTVSYANIQDSDLTGTSLTADYSTNGGNNDDSEAAPHWIFRSDYTWTGGGLDDNWTNTDNWSGGSQYPGAAAGDTATINSGPVVVDSAVSIETLTLNEGSVTLNANLTVSDFVFGDGAGAVNTAALDTNGYDLTVANSYSMASDALLVSNGAGTISDLTGVDSASTIRYKAGAASAPFNVTVGGARNYANLEITGGSFAPGAAVTAGAVTVTTPGVLAVGATTLTVASLTGTGEVTVSTGTIDSAGTIDVATVTASDAANIFTGGSFSPTAFTANTSTVTFDGATTPVTAGALTYNNLTVNKAAVGNVVNLGALASIGGALTVTQGTLNLAGNISPSGAVTVNGVLAVGATTLTVASLTGTGEVTVSTGTIDSAGTIDVATVTASDASNIFTGGSFSPTAFTANTSTVIFDGATTPVTAGALTYNNLTVNKAAVGNVVNLGALASIGGALNVTQGTLNLAGSISPSGAVTVNGVLAVGATTLTVASLTGTGEVTVSTGTIDSAGTIDVATVTASDASNIFTGGSFSPTTFTANTSTVTFDGAATPVTAGALTYNNLTVNKAVVGNVVNLGALASIGGALTVTQGTLNLAGNISPSGAVTVNGVLAIGATTLTVASLTGTGAVTISTGTIDSAGTIDVATVTASDAANIFTGGSFSPTAFTANTSTVTFDGAATPVTAGALTYNNFTVNKAAVGNVVNLGALASIGGALNVTQGTLNLAGNISPSGAVTVNGVLAVGATTLTVASLTGTGEVTISTGTIDSAGTIDVATVTASDAANIFTGGSFSPTAFTANTSTVTFDGAATPVTAGALTYNNLTVNKAAVGNVVNLGALASIGGALNVTQGTLNLAGNISPSGAVTINGVLAVGATTLTVASLTGTGEVTVSTGTIDSAGTIDVATVTASDAANIFTGGSFSPTAFTANTSIVTFDGAATPVTAGALTYNNLTVNKAAVGNVVNLGALASIGGALTVTQGTLNLAGNISPSGAVTVNGVLAVGATTLTVASLTGTGEVTVSTGTIDSAGTIDVATVTASDAANIFTGGSFSPTAFTANTSTVTFDGATTPVTAGALTYNNLTVNKAAVGLNVNLASGASGTGDLLITQGTLTLQDDLTLAGSVDIAAGTLDAGGNNITLGGDWSNGGTFTHGGGTQTVTFNGSGAQAINSGGTGFNNLTVNKTGGAVSYGATDVTASGDFSLSAGMLTQGTGVITLNGTTNTFGGTFVKNAGGSIVFSGGGAQTLSAGGQDLGNITVSGASTVLTLTNQTVTFDDVTVGAGAELALSGTGGAVNVQLNTGSTLTNNGTVRVVDTGTNMATLSGSGGTASYAGNEIAWNSQRLTFSSIQYGPNMNLGAGAQLILGDGNNSFAGINTGTSTFNANDQNWTSSGSWDNTNGTLSNIGGTATFSGAGQTITSGGTGAGKVFGAVSVDGSYSLATNAVSVASLTGAGTLTTNDQDLTVSGNVGITTLNATAAGAAETVTVGGDFTPGTFVSPNSIVILNGSASVTAGAFAYNNLTVNKAAAADNISLASGASVTGDLLITRGTLTQGGTGGTLAVTGTLTIAADGRLVTGDNSVSAATILESGAGAVLNAIGQTTAGRTISFETDLTLVASGFIRGTETTVVSTGTGNLTSASNNLGNLTKNTGGTLTLQDDLTLAGSVNIAAGALAVGGQDFQAQTATVSEAVTIGTGGAFSTVAGLTVETGGSVSASDTGAVTVGDTLTVNGAGSVSVVDGDLMVSAGGMTLNGTSTISATGSGNINTSGDSLIASTTQPQITANTGAILFNGNVILGADTTLTTTNSNITFNGTVNGAFSLNLTAGTGSVSVAGVVGTSAVSATRLSSLTITIAASAGLNAVFTSGTQSVTAATINLNGSTYQSTTPTTGTITFEGVTTLTTGVDVATNDSDITFTSTVNGAFILELNSGTGALNLNGVVGGTTPLSYLLITGCGNFSCADISRQDLYLDADGSTVVLQNDITVKNFYFYRGTLNLGTHTFTTSGDFAVFGSGYNADDVDRGAASNEFAYPPAGGLSYYPGGGTYTAVTGAFSTAPSAAFSAPSGATIAVGGNFYNNGANMSGAGSWNLNIQDNSASNPLVNTPFGLPYAAAFNMSVGNCVAAGGYVMASSAGSGHSNNLVIDGGSNTNWDFSAPVIASAEIVKDNIIRLTFSEAIENDNNEISAAVAGVYTDYNASGGSSTAMVSAWIDADDLPPYVFTTTDGAGDLSTFYLMAGGGLTWNTDATGASASVSGTGTDRTGTQRNAVPDLSMLKGLFFDAAGKNPVINYTENAKPTFTAATDKCGPVLHTIAYGRAVHNQPATRLYDGHNYFHLYYSEPVDIGTNAGLAAAVAGTGAAAENFRAMGTFIAPAEWGGDIRNDAGNVLVDGYFSYNDPAGSGPMQRGWRSGSAAANALYRTDPAAATSPFTNADQELRIYLSGYLDGALGSDAFPGWHSGVPNPSAATVIDVVQNDEIQDMSSNPVDYAIDPAVFTAGPSNAEFVSVWDTDPPAFSVYQAGSPNYYEIVSRATTATDLINRLEFFIRDDLTAQAGWDPQNDHPDATAIHGVRDFTLSDNSHGSFPYTAFTIGDINEADSAMTGAYNISLVSDVNNLLFGIVSASNDPYFTLTLQDTGHGWDALSNLKIGYDSSVGLITDLAGNLLPSTSSPFYGIERIPPKIDLTLASAGSDKVYVRFTEPVFNFNKDTLVKSSLVPQNFSFSIPGVSVVALEPISRLSDGIMETWVYLSSVLTADAAYSGKLVPVESQEYNIYDRIDNYMTAEYAHRVTDIGLGIAVPVWAADRVRNEELLGTGGDARIRTFDGTGYLMDSDITLEASIRATAYQGLSLNLYYDSSPASSVTNNGFWLPSYNKALVPAANTEARALSAFRSSAGARDFLLPENDSEMKVGNRIEFLLKMGDLYCADLTDPNDPRTIVPWSFRIRDIVKQTAGVTILNNVIDPEKGEKTVITYTLDRPGMVTVNVFNLGGDLVNVLHRGSQAAGTYYYSWDGKNRAGNNAARGVYFIRVVGPGLDEFRKVMIVKD